MVCGFPCFPIRYAILYDAVKIGLSMGTKPRTGRVALSSNLALFTLNSANVVFANVCVYFPSPCSFRKCSLSFAGARLELLNLALKIMYWGRWLVNPYCTYSSDHFLILLDIVRRDWNINKKITSDVQSRQSQVDYWAHQVPRSTDIKAKRAAIDGHAERDITNHMSGVNGRAARSCHACHFCHKFGIFHKYLSIAFSFLWWNIENAIKYCVNAKSILMHLATLANRMDTHLCRTPENDSPNPWGSIELRLRTTALMYMVWILFSYGSSDNQLEKISSLW